MKLYLSSYRVPTLADLMELLGKPANQARAAIVPNAKDYTLADERAMKVDELVSDLSQLGFTCDEIDLRDYDEGQQIHDVLKQYDLVWMAGGNSFVLRAEMRRSGLDKVINQLLDEGLVYCGESAGAIVAGLTLQGAEVADEPALADQVIWEGLGLVERVIAPHADSADFPEYVNHMKKLYANEARVLYLNDNQALVVNGSRQKLATAA